MGFEGPPADLFSRPLRRARVPKALARISRQGYPDPFFWSRRGTGRFDVADGRYGVLYTAQDFETAVVEVFGDAWLGTRVLARSELEGFEALEFAVMGNLRVADLTGRALNLLGTDARLFATRDYETTRAWSKCLMEHPRAVDGLRYPSRKNPKKLNYALYDTTAVRAGLSLAGRGPLLEHPEFHDVLDRYEVGVVG